MNDDDEPFLINNAAIQPRRSFSTRDDEAKIEQIEMAESRFKHGNNLRRRYRRRQETNDEIKSGDEEKGEDLKANPAAEESKELEPSILSRPSSSRFRKTISAALPSSGNKPPRLTMPMMHNSTSNYIRRPPDEKLKEKFKNKLRGVADGVPEVHFIGEITEGVGFKDTFVSCKWYLEWGRAWSFLEGEDSSQTQYASSDDGVQVFNHPIDVHFASASIQGWPRMVVQAWELDEFGRSILAGYGFVHMPTNPGYHELEVYCWKPSGSIYEELQSFFLGSSSCLVNEELIFGKAWEKRSQIKTVSSGVVKLNVTVLLRHFNEQKVE